MYGMLGSPTLVVRLSLTWPRACGCLPESDRNAQCERINLVAETPFKDRAVPVRWDERAAAEDRLH